MQQKQEEKSYQQELNRIHGIVTGKVTKSSLDRNIFELATMIGGVGDITGREYRIIYNEDKSIKGFRQLPVKISTLISLFHEANEYGKRQEIQMKDKVPHGPKKLRGR